MFKNREFSIRVRKADKPETATVSPVDDDQRAKLYSRIAQKMIATTAVVFYGYILVDTYRQVTIEANRNNQAS